MDRSLRRLGQLLVGMGALLGVVLGVSLALIVEHAETSKAVTGPERERVAVLAASSPTTDAPSSSRPTSAQDRGNGTDASGDQRAESGRRADQRDSKSGESRKDKADGRGKDKPGKDK